MAPYRAILRCYVCKPPLSRDTFSVGIALGLLRKGVITPWHFDLYIGLFQTYLCGTPVRNISHNTCAIPLRTQVRKSFTLLSLQVSRDVESVAGPLSIGGKGSFSKTWQAQRTDSRDIKWKDGAKQCPY